MKKIILALALGLGATGVAQAASADKAGCCKDMKSDCCKDMKADCCKSMKMDEHMKGMKAGDMSHMDMSHGSTASQQSQPKPSQPK